MEKSRFTDTDIIFQTLSYATRMLASEKDIDQLIENSLDILSDFGHSNKVEFIILETKKKHEAILAGLLENGLISKLNKEIDIKDSILEKIIIRKRPEIVTGELQTKIYLPLIGSGNSAIGILVLHVNDHKKLEDIELNSLIILTTLIDVSLEYAQSARLAMFDSLTGLYIRRQMDTRLQEELHRIKRYGGSLAICMIDIDHFKLVNDTHGHLFGDKVLIELAQLIRSAIRTNVDVPCRFGGEEFIIILPNTDSQKAFEMTDRLRQICAKHSFTYNGQTIHATFSAGVTSTRSSDISPREFIAQADAMLYKAKEEGRNRICIRKEGS